MVQHVQGTGTAIDAYRKISLDAPKGGKQTLNQQTRLRQWHLPVSKKLKSKTQGLGFFSPLAPESQITHALLKMPLLALK